MKFTFEVYENKKKIMYACKLSDLIKKKIYLNFK